MMPELRQNMATKEWLMISSERAKRPEELIIPLDPTAVHHPEWDAGCPFGPGNEELDLEVLRIPETGPWLLKLYFGSSLVTFHVISLLLPAL